MALITQQRLRELVVYEPETGLCRWTPGNQSGGKRKAGAVAGCVRSDGYVKYVFDYKRYEAGRLIWFYMTGRWPEGDVDHIDGNPSNNRWANLRDIPHARNMENRRRANKQNTAGKLGVTAAKDGRFYARINVGGKVVALGGHQTADLAHDAYVSAKRQLHEGNTL